MGLTLIHILFISLFPLALMVSCANDMANHGPAPVGVVDVLERGLPPMVPGRKEVCDLNLREHVLRCTDGAGVELQMADGSRALVKGPLIVHFGLLK